MERPLNEMAKIVNESCHVPDGRKARLERARRAAADAARRSGPQAIGGGMIKWDHDTALTPAQRGALILLARELRDGDLIEYGAADVRTQRGDMGDVTVFVTELRGDAPRIYLLDEEGGRHNA